MAGQVESDGGAFAAAAAEYQRQYGALVDAISAFDGHALEVSGAFGVLGPSVTLLQQYVTMTEQVMRGLDTLATYASQAATGLTRTAATYAGADQASTMHGGPS